jgi:glutathione S-transferase
VLLGGGGWPANLRKRASARSVCAEVHADFPQLRQHWPLNCKATHRLTPTEAIANEIARIDAIWSCCRRKFGETGDYLYGRFSIADCLFAARAITFHTYGAELSAEAQRYCDTLLANPFVQAWMDYGRREKEPLSIAFASNM